MTQLPAPPVEGVMSIWEVDQLAPQDDATAISLAEYARADFADTRETRWETMGEDRRDYFRKAVALCQAPLLRFAPQDDLVEAIPLPNNYTFDDLRKAKLVDTDPFYELPSEQALKLAAKVADIQWVTASMLLKGGNIDPGFVRTLYALARSIDAQAPIIAERDAALAAAEDRAAVLETALEDIWAFSTGWGPADPATIMGQRARKALETPDDQ